MHEGGDEQGELLREGQHPAARPRPSRAQQHERRLRHVHPWDLVVERVLAPAAVVPGPQEAQQRQRDDGQGGEEARGGPRETR